MQNANIVMLWAFTGAAASAQTPAVLVSTIAGSGTEVIPNFILGDIDPSLVDNFTDLNRLRGSASNDYWALGFRDSSVEGVIVGQGTQVGLAYLEDEYPVGPNFDLSDLNSATNYPFINSSGTVLLSVDLAISDEEIDNALITIDFNTGASTIVARENDSINSLLTGAFLGRVEYFDYLDSTTNPRLTINYLDDGSTGGIADDGTIAFNYGLHDSLSATDPANSTIIPQRGRLNGVFPDASIATDEAIIVGFGGGSPQLFQINVAALGGAINVNGAQLFSPTASSVRYSPDGANWMAIVDADRSPDPDPLADGTDDPMDIDELGDDDLVIKNGDIVYVEKGPTTWLGEPTTVLSVSSADMEPSGEVSAFVFTTLGWKVALGSTDVATAYQPITPGASEIWTPFERSGTNLLGSPFLDISGNANGDHVVAGFTDDGDAGTIGSIAWVLNGTTVILRSGDALDLDGDGSPDTDAFVSIENLFTASPEPLFSGGVLTDDGWFYTVVGVRSVANDNTYSAATYRGQALIRVRAFTPTP